MNNTQTWLSALHRLATSEDAISPRGLATREILNMSTVWDMRRPGIFVPERALSNEFMHAEAYWILSGQADVDFMKQFSQRIVDFSDSGMFYFGAYGPKFIQQVEYIYKSLAADMHTRQAVISIWRESPMASKDIPCTLSLQFIIRNGYIHTIANMRSSDVWLGLPYDNFNFSMMTWFIALMYNNLTGIHVVPGKLYINAGSGHLYQSNYEKAVTLLNNREAIATQDWYMPFPQFAQIHSVKELKSYLFKMCMEV